MMSISIFRNNHRHAELKKNVLDKKKVQSYLQLDAYCMVEKIRQMVLFKSVLIFTENCYKVNLAQSIKKLIFWHVSLAATYSKTTRLSLNLERRYFF